jgi:hypothetical protein
MMMQPAEIKLFCFGGCGRFVVLPAHLAQKIIDECGFYKEDAPSFVCGYCHQWFNNVTSHLLIKEKK